MTVFALTAVLAVWCLAGTVVGLILCQAVRWAHGPVGHIGGSPVVLPMGAPPTCIAS